MSDSPDFTPARHVLEFRQLFAECEQLYRRAGEETVHANPQLVAESAQEFLERMVDLAHGLAIKIFVEIAQCDWHWTPMERELAVELMDLVWRFKPEPEQVRDALETLVEESGKLTWSALLGPFERLPSFREQVSRLETLVSRLANMAAKFDGTATSAEINRIKHIQGELRRLLVPIEIDTPEDDAVPPQATQKIFLSRGEFRHQPEPSKPAIPAKHAKPQQLAEALLELEQLIGVASVKRDIQELVHLLKFQQQREAHGLARTPMSLHMVFLGNPGTGKTTVARLIGKILGALGVLSRGHLVETDRSGLVASYVGQTGPRTNKKIDEAIDGVLFIDEAYSLVAENAEDAYGAEAIQALIKRMEDDRERLIVVLAGYPDPMHRMIDSNPGLSSRFSRCFDFPDYTATELGQIFQRLCKQQDYVLPAATRLKLLLGFRYLLDNRDERFGNGRLARNIFEASIRRLASRIAAAQELSKDMLTHLEPADIVIDGVPAGVFADANSATLRIAVLCPGCQKESRCAPDFLGRQVRCKRCRREFVADWGEVVE